MRKTLFHLPAPYPWLNASFTCAAHIRVKYCLCGALSCVHALSHSSIAPSVAGAMLCLDKPCAENQSNQWTALTTSGFQSTAQTTSGSQRYITSPQNRIWVVFTCLHLLDKHLYFDCPENVLSSEGLYSSFSQATGLWVKTLAAKPDNLSWLPGTHMVEGDSQLVQLLLWPLHMGGSTELSADCHTWMAAHEHTRTPNKCKQMCSIHLKHFVKLLTENEGLGHGVLLILQSTREITWRSLSTTRCWDLDIFIVDAENLNNIQSDQGCKKKLLSWNSTCPDNRTLLINRHLWKETSVHSRPFFRFFKLFSAAASESGALSTLINARGKVGRRTNSSFTTTDFLTFTYVRSLRESRQT